MAKFGLFSRKGFTQSGQRKNLGRDAKQRQKESFVSLTDDELRSQLLDALGEQKPEWTVPKIDQPVDFFAALAEAAHRTVGLNPFASQIEGAQALLQGNIIQMPTGEGKTLSGALAAVGFALSDKRTHILTVNSYLAARDQEWMQPFYAFFDITTGAITEDMSPEQRREVYGVNVVYAPVSEVGFDHLRNGLVTDAADELDISAEVAIIDEADSVLVDEALVPLILAGSQDSSAPSDEVSRLVADLDPEQDFEVSEDGRSIFLLDPGAKKLERQLGIDSLYSEDNVGTLLVQVNVALHAQHLVHRDVDYLVDDGKLSLIDNSRGRVAQLQRWPDGLQAAVEVKEGIPVSSGGRILDSLTVQELVGDYSVVSGMTGTALGAKDQFEQFYESKVQEISPNEPLIRFDEKDRIFLREQDRDRAVIDYIVQRHEQNQPVLVGTHTVEDSEAVAHALEQKGIDVAVLNAKNPAAEAEIISQAGRPGAVTVSTQMAGRGTDIRLGGADESQRDEAIEAGGLAVVGLGRFRSSRLDYQLRGRAGRQGDPGHSVFFVSLEDDVVNAGGEGSFTAKPNPHGELTDAKAQHYVEHSQRVTEGQLLNIHANTWKYNKLIADQRNIVIQRRKELLEPGVAWAELQRLAPARAAELSDRFPDDQDMLDQAARDIMLYHLDRQRSEHLAYLDDVRESIHLRAIARESPLDEFHRLSIDAFRELAQSAQDKAVDTFEQIRFSDDGPDLAGMGIQAPSATWTYMISDNPLSTGKRSVGSSLAALWK